MTTIASYRFNYSSRYRDRGTNQHPYFLIKPAITLSDEQNYLQLRFLGAQIPFSWKQVSSANNQLNYTFVVIQDAINTSGTITVPEGNYSATSLLNELAVLISAEMVAKGFPINKQCDFLFQYSSTTGRATLGITNIPNGHDVVFTLRYDTSDLFAELIGMDVSLNTQIAWSAAGVDLSVNTVSPNMVLVSPVNAICIRSDGLKLHPLYHREQYVDQVLRPSNLLYMVPIMSGANTWLIGGSSEEPVRLGTSVISEADFYLTGVDFTALYLQGIPFSVQFAIDEVEPPGVRDARQVATIQMLQLNEKLAALQEERDQLQASLGNTVSKLRRRLKPVPEEGGAGGAEQDGQPE